MTAALERRRKVLQLAHEYNFLILEGTARIFCNRYDAPYERIST